MAYIVATRIFGQERYLRGTVWVMSRDDADLFDTPAQASEAAHGAGQSNPTASRAAFLVPAGTRQTGEP